MRGNARFGNFGDITVYWMVIIKIRAICLSRELVPFAGKHTTATNRLEAYPKAANSREEIDEGECAALVQLSLLEVPIRSMREAYRGTTSCPQHALSVLECRV